MAARTLGRREAARDDGRGVKSLDDHANDHQNQWSEEPAGAPLASAKNACINFERSMSALDRVVAALVALMAPWSRAIGG